MLNMSTKILPVTDLRRRTREIIEGVKQNSDTIYITQHGRPEVVLLDYDRYEAIMAQLKQHNTQLKQQTAVDLLQSWIDVDDPAEQQTTGNALIQGLDENRLSDRPLYPTHLKEKTW